MIVLFISHVESWGFGFCHNTIENLHAWLRICMCMGCVWVWWFVQHCLGKKTQEMLASWYASAELHTLICFNFLRKRNEFVLLKYPWIHNWVVWCMNNFDKYDERYQITNTKWTFESAMWPHHRRVAQSSVANEALAIKQTKASLIFGKQYLNIWFRNSSQYIWKYSWLSI